MLLRLFYHRAVELGGRIHWKTFYLFDIRKAYFFWPRIEGYDTNGRVIERAKETLFTE